MNTLNYVVKKYGVDLSKIATDRYVILPNIRRVDLAKLFSELNFKVGAEVGVMRGKFSEIICQENPQLKLYAIDPWIKYDGYHDFTETEQFSKFYHDAVKILSKYNCKIIRKLSMDAVKDFKDESLDFVYIDANHSLKYVVEDLVEWNKKVRKGGIIAGHDFKVYYDQPFASIEHVVQALDAYVACYQVDYLFILGKRMSKNRDVIRSWFFIKK